MSRHTVREVTITIDPDEDHPSGAVMIFYQHGGVFYPSVNGAEMPTFPYGKLLAKVGEELAALTSAPRAVGDPPGCVAITAERLARLERIEIAARTYADTPGGAAEEYRALRKALE